MRDRIFTALAHIALAPLIVADWVTGKYLDYRDLGGQWARLTCDDEEER